MIEIKANTLKQIPLGRMGENLARKIVFDISAWITTYGDGQAVLIHQRPQDAIPFPVAIEQHETEVWWPVTKIDTASSAGTGQCELQYYVGDTLVKSKSFITFVEESMGLPSEEEPPAPGQGWVDQIIAVGVAAQNFADAAKADADLVSSLAAEVEANADQTAQYVSDSVKAKEAAQTAQHLAETARSCAEDAQNAAELAKVSAEQSSTEANESKLSAETSMDAARGSAAEAARALADLKDLYQQMQTWAQGVVQSVELLPEADINMLGKILILEDGGTDKLCICMRIDNAYQWCEITAIEQSAKSSILGVGKLGYMILK